MSSKPETNFYTSVHAHLPPVTELHREKNANPYRGGTPDFWFSCRRDLWVEYKFIEVPKRDDTVIDFISGKDPHISGLQQDWIEHRLSEGRNVWVIVGCKAGGVIYRNDGWRHPITAGEFRCCILDRKTVAAELRKFLT